MLRTIECQSSVPRCRVLGVGHFRGDVPLFIVLVDGALWRLSDESVLDKDQLAVCRSFFSDCDGVSLRLLEDMSGMIRLSFLASGACGRGGCVKLRYVPATDEEVAELCTFLMVQVTPRWPAGEAGRCCCGGCAVG